MNITVECKKRPEGSKPRALRREGIVPAALYGHNGAESVSLVMDGKEARNLLKKAAINNTLVDLNIPDLPWQGKALIREVQAHPWKRTIQHLSFFSVSADQKISLVVPIELTGESKGVKLGGILEQNLTEFQITCSGDNIPDSIDIDISNFDIGTNLSVSEIIVPEGVTITDDLEQTVFSISAPAKMTEAEEEEAAAEVTPTVTPEA